MRDGGQVLQLDLCANMNMITIMKAWLFFLCLILVSCNELPVGEDELRLRGEFDPQFLSLSIFSTFTEYKNVNTGTSYNLVLGKNAEYESRVLLQFDFPDSTYQGLDEIKLILNINGDFTNDTVAFSLHLMDEAFSESEADWTRRNLDVQWDIPGGDYRVDSIRYGIAQGDSIVLYFNYLELAEIQAASGMIIIPRDTGFCHLQSKDGGSAGRIILKKNETTIPAFVEADCHIITGPEPSLLEDWIGSGFVYRDFVKFNYDPLLDSSLAVYAELSFRCAEYFSHRDSIEIGVRELTEPFSTFDTPTGPLIALKKIAVGDTLVTIDIVKHAQHLIEHPDSNFGFYIGISPETYDISRVKLVRGSHRLNIGYIMPPEPRSIQ
jgi:hypothetical protein